MRLSPLPLAAILAAGLAWPARDGAAQVIRCWTNANGGRECSDLPPPPSAKDVKDVRGRSGRIEVQEPFVVRQARERFPVTLWANECGEPCTSARSYLQQRGVPFGERDPSRPEQVDEFRKLTGGVMQVPVLQVGSTRITGFEESQWATTLDAAGYPRSPVAPVPAAPPPPPKPAAKPASAQSPGGPGPAGAPGGAGAPVAGGPAAQAPQGGPAAPQPSGQPAFAPPGGFPLAPGQQPPGFTTTPGPIPPPR